MVAVTAAMPDGTGLAAFGKEVSGPFFLMWESRRPMGSRLLQAWLRPGSGPWWRSILPSLQRAYDQVLHDVCIQNLPVLFAVDRAGLVGSDGETHQESLTIPS